MKSRVPKTQSFRNIVAGAVGAAALLAGVTVAGSASAAILGCCIGPTCSNQNESTCKASGGTALDSTCKNANDPRCGSCASIPEAAPRGLCNAYCDRLDCPAGHAGQPCDQLRRNWMRATNLTAFPCDVPDRAVCCQCPGAGPTCSSARRCLKGQCQIIDRCINGECPKPECCECSNNDPPVCGYRIPGFCRLKGCTPEADAVCTERGLCEQCPCGTECKNAAGDVGRCVNVPGSKECACQVPAPCGFDAAGQCGGECDDTNEKCAIVTDAAGNKTCECGPPPDPCLNRVPCDATCVDPLGHPGVCQDTNADAGCRCLPPQPCGDTAATCAGPCVIDGIPGKCTPGTPGTSPACECLPPPQPCNTSDPDTCDGLCTVAGTLCLPDPNGGPCRCQPPPKCEDGVAPQCGGPCPAGSSCQPAATGNACLCVPSVVPCETSTAPQCGGSCTAAGLFCRAIIGSTQCQCLPDTPCDTACSPNSPCTKSGKPGVCARNATNGTCECNALP